MFKFNFGSSEEKNNMNCNDDNESAEGNKDWLVAQKHQLILSPGLVLEELREHQKSLSVGTTVLHYLPADYVTTLLKKEGKSEVLVTTVDGHSDLEPAVYEGGLKLWESCIDLVEYIDRHCLVFPGDRVLEAGCGAAIPGIYALCHGATVCLQDYNREVIDYLTIPGVLLSSGRDDSVSCYSGDWASFAHQFSNSECKFDLILTSETIYNPFNYSKLLGLFTDALRESGSVLVAAKTIYFGVGGGTRDFEDAIIRHGRFSSEIVWKLEGGVQREILKLRFKT